MRALTARQLAHITGGQVTGDASRVFTAVFTDSRAVLPGGLFVALRGERFKYITYYGLWDADELYDLKADPGETKNLLYEPAHRRTAEEMEKKLYAQMEELGGMEIPLNAPLGGSMNKRLRSRAGAAGAPFPEPFVVEKPLNQNAK